VPTITSAISPNAGLQPPTRRLASISGGKCLDKDASVLTFARSPGIASASAVATASRIAAALRASSALCSSRDYWSAAKAQLGRSKGQVISPGLNPAPHSARFPLQ
jgi:hypothetical protein